MSLSAFQRLAVQRVIDRATAAGVAVPGEVSRLATAHLCGVGSVGARLWAAAHPEDETLCCYASTNGPEHCGCWVAEYDRRQARPRPPLSAEELRWQSIMCGDCAFRPGSPERSTPHEEEALLDLAGGASPFWCHEGIRRRVRWRHPDGRVIDGDPADYDPPIIAGIPYRADGSPALLCAGWLALSAARR